MTSITSNQLIQAAALDPSLAFNAVFNQTRSLIQQSAYAGVQGLLNSLSESNAYTQSLAANQDAIAELAKAEALRASHQFATGDSTQVQQNETAVINDFTAQITSSMASTLTNAASAAQTLAPTIRDNPTDINISNNLQTAATDATNALSALQNAKTPAQVTAAIGQLSTAYSACQTVLSEAQGLSTSKSFRATLISDITALSNSISAITPITTTPIATIAQTTPTVQSLNSDQGDSAYTLATWGNTGYTTLMDPSGNGVLIGSNGQVSSLNGSTSWNFGNTGTFLLPDSTKITISPSSSGAASITALWGDHLMTIDNVKNGSTPSVDIQSGGGRALEGHTSGDNFVPTFNDGYIFSMGSNASQWKDTNGNTLQGGENAAPTAAFNQYRVDPTAVSISSNVSNFMSTYGVNEASIGNSTSQFNDSEIANILGGINFVVSEIQANYAQTIANTQTAATALGELTTILDKLSTQSDSTQTNRSQLTAQENEELVNIRLRLETALSQLTGNGPSSAQANQQVNPANSSGNLLTDTENLLQGLQQFNSASPASALSAQSPVTASSLLGGSGSLLSQLAGGTSLSPQQLQAVSQAITGALEQAVAGGVDLQGAGGVQQLAGQLAAQLGQALGLGASAVQSLAQQFATALSSPQGQALLQSGAQGLAALSQSLFQALAVSGTPGGSGGQSGASGPNPFEKLDPSSQALRRAGKLISGLGNFSSKLDAVLTGSGHASGATAAAQSAFGAQPLPSQLNVPSQAPSTQNPETPGGGSHNTFAQNEAGVSQAQLNPFTQASTQPTFNQLAQNEAGLSESQFNPLTQNTNFPGGLFGNLVPPPADSTTPPENPNAIPPSSDVTFNFNTGFKNQGQDGTSGLSFNTQNISKNFQTDRSLVRIFEQRLDQAIQVQQQQTSQAGNLFTLAQDTVKRFVQVIAKDEHVQKLIMSDDLSDAQQVKYNEKMSDLRKRWGIDWGSSADSSTPAGEQQLVSRVIQSGMMV